jgi:hypothetical protein
MWKKILFGLAVVILAAVAFVATRPAEYVVERRASIGAPPALVYAALIDFHRWRTWSPWAALDPAQQEEYGGAASGVGATYHWSGNDAVGEGRMTVTEARPDEYVAIRLEFLRPFPTDNVVEYEITADDAGSVATWRMTGRNGFVGKAYALFVDMDSMLGSDFEKGLSALGRVVEADARAVAAPPAPSP